MHDSVRHRRADPSASTHLRAPPRVRSTARKQGSQHGAAGRRTEGHGAVKKLVRFARCLIEDQRDALYFTAPWPSVRLPAAPCMESCFLDRTQIRTADDVGEISAEAVIVGRRRAPPAADLRPERVGRWVDPVDPSCPDAGIVSADGRPIQVPRGGKWPRRLAGHRPAFSKSPLSQRAGNEERGINPKNQRGT
jgi:hypothetical protein